MIAVNYTEFRKDLKKYLDRVENDQESLVLKSGTGKGTIVFSIDEYNSIMEIMHLLKSKKMLNDYLSPFTKWNKGNLVKLTHLSYEDCL